MVPFPDFAKRSGLVTVVVQDFQTNEVLMVAFTDEAGFKESCTTKKGVYYSTSRKERWMKGETSGDTQDIVEILIDCDGDALVYKVKQNGKGACHTGNRTCFYRPIDLSSQV
jgi:phosphoribosyl-AMP cyclohydrolase